MAVPIVQAIVVYHLVMPNVQKIHKYIYVTLGTAHINNAM